jgi:uncharacterized protein (TIRG00374 family)
VDQAVAVSSEARAGSAAMEELALSAPRPKRSTVHTWTVRTATLTAAVTFFVLLRDQLPDPAAMLAVAADAEPGWLVLVVIAEMLSMGSFARLQRRLLLIGGVRISLRRAFAVTYAGNALSTTLPAGPAVSVVYSFRQFRRGGASVQVATAVILLGGIATSSTYTIIGLLTLLGEPGSRVVAGAALAAATASGVLFWRSPGFRRTLTGFTRRVLRSALRHPRAAPLAHAMHRARGVVRLGRRDWGAVLALSILNWAFELTALIAATRALGIYLAPHEVVISYFAAQAAGSVLPLLPGGLGAVEAGLVTSLVAFGAHAVPAGGAVAVYRLVSFWAVVAVGWLAWLALRASEENLGRAQQWTARTWRSTGISLTAIAGWPAQHAGLPAGPSEHPPAS